MNPAGRGRRSRQSGLSGAAREEGPRYHLRSPRRSRGRSCPASRSGYSQRPAGRFPHHPRRRRSLSPSRRSTKYRERWSRPAGEPAVSVPPTRLRDSRRVLPHPAAAAEDARDRQSSLPSGSFRFPGCRSGQSPSAREARIPVLPGKTPARGAGASP